MNAAEDPLRWTVGLVGYGEAGQILAEDLRALAVAVVACDVKLGGPDEPALVTHAELEAPSSPRLPPDRHARRLGPACPECKKAPVNSASPGAKIEAAGIVEAAGGRYVEGAVMTAVQPHRARVPLLLGGPHAAMLQGPLKALGFAPKVASTTLGVASATKCAAA